MQFLAPLFFVALAGLAIPVLLHLTQREKKQVIRFPSLMFVRRIPYQSVRRRKIHNWLLLFVRLAALALIVAAFARPLFRTGTPLVPSGTGARELVILLDTSYSMSYSDRWAQARAAAEDALRGLNASDRASLVLFSSGADILVRSSSEMSKLTAGLSTAKPGAGATRYGPALKVAGSILADSTLPRREAVLISDFQRAGWQGEQGARLPAGAVLTPVVVKTAVDKPNLGVTGVTFARSTFSNQERVSVTAGVINRTARPAPTATVKLQVGNIPVGTKQVALEANGSGVVTFDPVTIGGRNLRGVVSLGDDALAADNTFNFVLSPALPLRITVVDRGGADARRYLADALAIGQAPRFEVAVRQPEALTDDDLRRSAVVLVNDTAVVSALARRLGRFVEQGGGLFVAAGESASWPQDVDLLPATVGTPVDRTKGEAARIGTLEYGHAIFEPFRGPRSGNFATAMVYEYRNVTPGKEAQVLARFDAGKPALLERRVGTGRVLLWASGLDKLSSDLPLKPVFPVFVQQSMRYLAAYNEPQPWLTVGQVLDPDVAAGQKGSSEARVVLTPSSRRVPLQDEGSDVLELTEQGFYEVRTADGNATDVAVVASNVDPAEGDLTPMDPNDIALAAAGVPGERTRAAASVLTPEAQENNQRLWWYLLCLGTLVLGIDTLLSNRMAKT
jgi:Aerotolerance regulator N-terminal/von Willebrand factor type A domain